MEDSVNENLVEALAKSLLPQTVPHVTHSKTTFTPISEPGRKQIARNGRSTAYRYVHDPQATEASGENDYLCTARQLTVVIDLTF